MTRRWDILEAPGSPAHQRALIGAEERKATVRASSAHQRKHARPASSAGASGRLPLDAQNYPRYTFALYVYQNAGQRNPKQYDDDKNKTAAAL